MTVSVDGEAVVTVKMPVRCSGQAIFLGAKGASIAASNGDGQLDDNGVCWYE